VAFNGMKHIVSRGRRMVFLEKELNGGDPFS
jgi:hypothetical protein